MALKLILKQTAKQSYRGGLERNFCEKAGCCCICFTWGGSRSLMHAQVPLVTAAVLSCLEQSDCHHPARLPQQTKKQTGWYPPHSGISVMNRHQWRIIYHSWTIFGRKHCLSSEICQEILFSWKFCSGWKMPSLKEPAHWYPAQETGMYKERSFIPGVLCEAQTTES